jgi:hypothetical protein
MDCTGLELETSCERFAVVAVMIMKKTIAFPV